MLITQEDTDPASERHGIRQMVDTPGAAFGEGWAEVSTAQGKSPLHGPCKAPVGW